MHKLLLNLNTHRFSGAQNHGFILEFLIHVSDNYRDERKAKQFVLDLLGMHLNGLFGVEQLTGKDHAAQSVPITFQTFLREYIQRNHLTSAIIAHVTAIWVRREGGGEGEMVGETAGETNN